MDVVKGPAAQGGGVECLESRDDLCESPLSRALSYLSMVNGGENYMTKRGLFLRTLAITA